MYPWWQADDEAAWKRACERVKPCAATVDVWRRDENFEFWGYIAGAHGPGDPRPDGDIEREERQRGGMWHKERRDVEYVRLRQAFEDARREVEIEHVQEQEKRRQRTLALRMKREMQKRKAEAQQAAAGTAEREPTPCVEVAEPSFFGR